MLRHAIPCASFIPPAHPPPNEVRRALKIALACDWFAPRLGGIEIHLRDLAIRLRARGHDVHVITPTRGDALVDGIPVHRVPARLFPGFGFVWNPGAYAALRRVLRAERFDLVHAHASIVSPAAYSAALAALADGTPTLVSFHSVLRNHAWWLGPIVRRLRLPARGARFAAVSGIVAREARALLGGAEVRVLSNAIDVTTWRVEPGPPNPEPLIVSVMRLGQKKRPRALVRMLARLRADDPALRFRALIVGDGSERRAVERLIARLRLDDIVAVHGRADHAELREIFRHADVFVLPTRLEAFGLAPLEARAAGLPVVVMRQAGVAEVLEDGVDGMLAASDDDMVSALHRLLTDSALRARIAAHNRTVPPPADWPAVLDAHEAIYSSLISA